MIYHFLCPLATAAFNHSRSHKSFSRASCRYILKNIIKGIIYTSRTLPYKPSYWSFPCSLWAVLARGISLDSSFTLGQFLLTCPGCSQPQQMSCFFRCWYFCGCFPGLSPVLLHYASTCCKPSLRQSNICFWNSVAVVLSSNSELQSILAPLTDLVLCLLARWKDSNSRVVRTASHKVLGQLCYTFSLISSSCKASMK